MEKVVLYLRYSSAGQTEQSIEGQRRVCEQYCERNGLQVVGMYIDRATSASKNTEKRVQFLKMIDDAKRGMFTAVVVYKLDRFARNRYDSAIYKSKLNSCGVRLLSATEGIDDSPESIVLESVLEGMAEYYSRELSQKVLRGKYESAKKHQWLCGKPPLGYNIEDKRLVINEAKADVVRKIFSLYAQGAGTTAIAKYLSENGMTGNNGSPISEGSLWHILHNKVYYGHYEYLDISEDGAIPAIISREQFDEVQKMIQKNRTEKSRFRSKANYMLSGKIFCGECGARMNGECGTSKNGEVHYYYSCKTRKELRACTKTPVRKEWIEELVYAEARKMLTPEYIDFISSKAYDKIEASSSFKARIESVSSDKAAAEKELANYLKAIASGVHSQSLYDKLEAVELRIADYNETLEELKCKSETQITANDIKVFLRMFLADEVDDENLKRGIMFRFVKAVYVYENQGPDKESNPHRIEIQFNLSDRHTESCSSDVTDSASKRTLVIDASVLFLFKIKAIL